MSTVIELSVEGMTCEHCVNAVTKALKAVPGVRDAKVSLEQKSARVEADQVDPEALLAAVREEGYEAALRS